MQGCKSRGIKLCGALAAAGMMAAWTSKCLPNYQREKYAVVTLVDCRSLLDPVLPSNHAGKPYFLVIICFLSYPAASTLTSCPTGGLYMHALFFSACVLFVINWKDYCFFYL